MVSLRILLMVHSSDDPLARTRITHWWQRSGTPEGLGWKFPPSHLARNRPISWKNLVQPQKFEDNYDNNNGTDDINNGVHNGSSCGEWQTLAAEAFAGVVPDTHDGRTDPTNS